MICDNVNDGWIVVGTGGLSEMETFRGDTEVPLMLVPDIDNE